ncbi:MAG: hypothetical protein M3295_05265, partial [Chloroflexota bacterium]|nr:hypothetical protein [Chloroflexota bacterium]
EGDFNVADANVSIDFTVESTDEGSMFSFELSNVRDEEYVVSGVFAKGGNVGGNFYDYRPDGTTAEQGLHAPVNPSGKWAGLSHISFCYALASTSSSPPASSAPASSAPASSPPASSPPASSVPASGSPVQSVQGGTGTPAGGTGPNTAMFDDRAGQLVMTVGSVLLLAASLGALALPKVVGRRGIDR